MFRARIIATLALVSFLGLSGCAASLAFLSVKAGTTVAQDRTVGQAIDDITLSTHLNTNLANESLGLYRKVNVKVVESRVLLTGTVPSEEAKMTAGRIAWATPGVRDVANELEIADGKSVGTSLSDFRISDHLRAKMMTDTKIAWVNYNVQTVNGTIYLMGIAKNQAELERVTLHARTIPGVKKVVSYVEFKDEPVQRASL